MKRGESVSDFLRPISQAPTQAWISNSIQVADIIEFVVSCIGPADVRMSSFSISEEFLRRIFFLRREGKVRSVSVVLDFKATNKTLILWPFIAQTVERCFLADNHSKVLLLSSGSARVAVVTSQNLTRGGRYESGVLSSDPAIFDALAESFDFIVDNKSVPFHEIYRQAVGDDSPHGGYLPPSLGDSGLD